MTVGALTVPRVARVEIVTADNVAVRTGVYRSLAEADAMLRQAHAQNPPPTRRPYDGITFSVTWSDGLRTDDFVVVTPERLDDGKTRGGLLRAKLLRKARVHADGLASSSMPTPEAEAMKATGRDLLRRLEVDALGLNWPRNTTTWQAPSLLPRPADAFRRLGERFANRRQIAHGSSTYPATNSADVRYLVNFISIALGNDLARFEPSTAAAIWNHWRRVVSEVERAILDRGDTDPYPANERLWRDQLPALVAMLEESVVSGGVLRNGRLAFRAVGRRGGPYPDWVQDLRGHSGVYVIREQQADGSTPIVYVGESHADRLHETLTRHFQTWRRWKGFWRGQYGEGHDPGLSYDRDACDAAAIVTPPKHALELESRLIRRLRPRDNLIGQEEVSDVPF
jgi:hypothetical protein